MTSHDDQPQRIGSAPANDPAAPVAEICVFAYDVSIWGAHECEASQLWSLRVTYDGDGRWVIRDGSGSRGNLLDDGGTFRLDTGQAVLRFDLQQALDIAVGHAATLTRRGITAAVMLREHAVHGCRDDAPPAAAPARRAVRPVASGRTPVRRRAGGPGR
jgi:hypothetical protein